MGFYLTYKWLGMTTTPVRQTSKKRTHSPDSYLVIPVVNSNFGVSSSSSSWTCLLILNVDKMPVILRYIESSAKCAPASSQKYAHEAFKWIWRTWAYSPSIPEYEFPRVHLGLVLIVCWHKTIGIKIVRTIEHFFVVRDSPINSDVTNLDSL